MNNNIHYITQVHRYRVLSGEPLGSGSRADHDAHISGIMSSLDRVLSSRTMEDVAEALAEMVILAAGYKLDAGQYPLITPEEIFEKAEFFADTFGINLLEAFDKVHASRMSAFVIGMDEMNETVAKYKEQGIEITTKTVETMGPISTFAVYAAYDGKHPAGTLLPGSRFVPVDWSVGEWRKYPQKPAPKE